MKNCTWHRCNRPAKKKLIGSKGQVWAHLCGRHNAIYIKNLKKALSETASATDTKRMIKVWIKAHGLAVVKDPGHESGK